MIRRLALVIVVLLSAGPAVAATVTQVDRSKFAGVEGISATSKGAIALGFAESVLLIQEEGVSIPDGKTIATGVARTDFYLVQDERPLEERTGYELLHCRAGVCLVRVTDLSELQHDPDVVLRPVDVSMEVVASPPRTAAMSTTPEIELLLAGLDAAAYDSHLKDLSTDIPTRYSCSNTTLTARDMIEQHFRSLGLETSTPGFTNACADCDGAGGYSVLGIKRGSARPDEYYVVVGHYDSNTRYPTKCTDAAGSNDNASGTAGVMELARLFAGVQTEATIYFLAAGGEEVGLLGSRAFVRSLVDAGELVRVKAAVNLDMISWYDQHYEMRVDGRDETAEQVAVQGDFVGFLHSYTDLDVVSTLDFGRSDHVSFLEQGAPAIMMIESDLLAYPYLHTPEDAYPVQDIPFAMMGLRAVGAALAAWAGYIAPTGIVLKSFEASAQGNRVDLTWETSSEIGNQGFNVYYRRRTPEGRWSKANATLIEGAGSSLEPHTYHFEHTGLFPGNYYYRLENVDTHGTPTSHGPISVDVRWFCGAVQTTSGRLAFPTIAALTLGLAIACAVRRLRRTRTRKVTDQAVVTTQTPECLTTSLV